MIELFDFQKQVVKEILHKYKNKQLKAAIFAEMGTGKTPMSLEIVNHSQIDYLFIVCPKDSVKAWEGALKKFYLKKYYSLIFVDEPSKVNFKLVQELIFNMETGKPFIMVFTYLGYSASAKMQEFLKPLWAKVRQVSHNSGIILDECHSIKNYKAKVTKQFMKLARILDPIKMKLLLTGTPHPNFLYEVYSQLQFLDHRPISYCPSYWSFYTTHTEIIDRDNFKIEKGNRLEDKAMEEIQKYAVYVSKDDVLDILKLEKLNSVDIEIEMSERNKDLYKMAKNLIDIVEHDISEISYAQIQKMTPYEKMSLVHGNKSRALSYMRQVIADSFEEISGPKILKLTEILSDGKSTIVYSPFIKSIQNLTRAFNHLNPLVITGDSPIPADIETNIRPLLLATQSKLKQGLNLQGYKRIIYYSNDWSLINRMQSEARIHRYGQEDDVEIINLVYKNTIEERIVELLKNKQNANRIILDLFKNNRNVDNFN